MLDQNDVLVYSINGKEVRCISAAMQRPEGFDRTKGIRVVPALFYTARRTGSRCSHEMKSEGESEFKAADHTDHAGRDPDSCISALF